MPWSLTRKQPGADDKCALTRNQLRGVDATAESPRSLTRRQPRAGDKVAECAILAEWPWILPAGAELASGEKTDDGEPIGPRVTLAVSPRLFSRRSWPPIRKKTNEREKSERSAVLGKSSRIFTRRHIPAQAERKPSAAKSPNGVAVSTESALFSCSAVVDLSSGKNKRRRRNRAKGPVGSNAIAIPPSGLTRAGGQKATFANQLRGFDATAESPWALTRKQPEADEELARCAILAEWPWMCFLGSGADRRRKNR